MKGRSTALVASLGLFSLVAQTLLFRDWLTALEGTELAIGAFFGAWLLWVAVGALAARRWARGRARGRARGGARGRARRHPRPAPSWPTLAALALLYLPAYALAHRLAFHARALIGVRAWEVLPLGDLLLASLLLGAPVSFVTGFLFTFACRRAAEDPENAGPLPVAQVYVAEAAGAFVGGAGVTLLLWGGVSAAACALTAGLVLALAAGLVLIPGARSSPHPFLRRVVGALPATLLLLALFLGAARHWTEAEDLRTWTRLLPAPTFRGAFSTAEGRYLFGEREGTFEVMAWGGVTETLPNGEHAGEVVATHLAYVPHPRRILVLGAAALAIAERFREVPGVTEVVWLHPDPAYPRALLDVLSPRRRREAERLTMPGENAREVLAGAPGAFDLVVLDLPDITTLSLNRYASREFLEGVRGALADAGVVSLRVSGGENHLSGETALLGASAWATLGEVFTERTLRPGDETWMLASRTRSLGVPAADLAAAFAAIEGADRIYPPDAVASLFPADRIAFQVARYEAVADEVGHTLLENTDAAPKALLTTLAVGLARAGRRGVAADLVVVLDAGRAILLGGLLILLLLRLVPALGTGGGRDKAAPADGAGWLVFTAGLTVMATGVVLLTRAQSLNGSLYLEIGLLSALTMLGLFLGGWLATRRLAAHPDRDPAFLVGLVLAFMVLLAAVAFASADLSRPVLAGLFLLVGLVGGAFFPLGAQRMAAAGRDTGDAGARLESIDHLGGALGALLTGLVLLPLFGAGFTLGILVLLVASNLVPALVPLRWRRTPQPTGVGRPPVPRWGLVLGGLAAWALWGSVQVASAEAARSNVRFEQVARALAGDDLRLESRHATLADGTGLDYDALFAIGGGDGDEVAGYVFSTRALAPDVVGYGGSIVLAVHVDPEGVLQEVAIVHARETPSYLDLLEGWEAKLAGRRLFVPDPFEGVDTVTGATVSSKAVLETVAQAGRRFGREVLGLDVGTAPARRRAFLPDADFVLLLLLTIGALFLRRRPNAWLRRLWLAGILVGLGVLLNLQLSMQQVFALLHLDLPGFVLTGSFFLLVLVPVVVLLFGNVYCGYLCPFGAAQELLGDLRRRAWGLDPGPKAWAWGRRVKYVLLAFLLVLVAVTGRREALAADPLVTFFSRHASPAALSLAVAVLLLSLVFGRFFCRNLCPAGAFLALLNRVRLLRRFVPPPRVGHCDLGVRHAWELDCIGCDRCRQEGKDK